MWSNSKQSDSPNPGPAQPAAYPPAQSSSNFNANSAPAASQTYRSSAPTARNLATLGPGLTVGQNGEIVSDVHAREVIVYGKVRGNLFAEDRIEVKKDGSVIGNITGGRVLIEDGAYLKGQIEIERGKSHKQASAELEPVGAGVGSNS